MLGCAGLKHKQLSVMGGSTLKHVVLIEKFLNAIAAFVLANAVPELNKVTSSGRMSRLARACWISMWEASVNRINALIALSCAFSFPL
jgi:hypothetical protein